MQNQNPDESNVFISLLTALAQGAPESAGGQGAPRQGLGAQPRADRTGQGERSGANRAGAARECRSCRSSGDSTARSRVAVIPSSHPEAASRQRCVTSPPVPLNLVAPPPVWLQIKATKS